MKPVTHRPQPDNCVIRPILLEHFWRRDDSWVKFKKWSIENYRSLHKCCFGIFCSATVSASIADTSCAWKKIITFLLKSPAGYTSCILGSCSKQKSNVCRLWKCSAVQHFRHHIERDTFQYIYHSSMDYVSQKEKQNSIKLTSLYVEKKSIFRVTALNL